MVTAAADRWITEPFGTVHWCGPAVATMPKLTRSTPAIAQFDVQNYQTVILQELELIYKHSVSMDTGLGDHSEAMPAVARGEVDPHLSYF